MKNSPTIFDPLRKKEVCLTPEEKVRQWCISMLHEVMEVPMHMMMSEAGMKSGNKKYRADIVVYDRQAKALAIVECKRPETAIDPEVIDQAIRYNMVLDVKFIILTNGLKTFMFRKADGKYIPVDKVPVYEEMLQ